MENVSVRFFLIISFSEVTTIWCYKKFDYYYYVQFFFNQSTFPEITPKEESFVNCWCKMFYVSNVLPVAQPTVSK